MRVVGLECFTERHIEGELGDEGINRKEKEVHGEREREKKCSYE